MYNNYKYSLSGQDQSMIQVFLRTLSPVAIENAIGGRKAFNLLHTLTYANDGWSQEPKHEVIKDE